MEHLCVCMKIIASTEFHLTAFLERTTGAMFWFAFLEHREVWFAYDTPEFGIDAKGTVEKDYFLSPNIL